MSPIRRLSEWLAGSIPERLAVKLDELETVISSRADEIEEDWWRGSLTRRRRM